MDLLGSKAIYRAQCRERMKILWRQGYDFDKDAWEKELDALPDSYDAIVAFAERLYGLPVRKDWPYSEPNLLPGIQAERPEKRQDVILPRCKELELKPATLKDHVFGGVFGRICGCILGKPFEMNWEKQNIQDYLQAVNAWPLRDYAPHYSPYSNLANDTDPSCRELLSYAQPDDDITYFAVCLQVLENFGRGFTTDQVARTWLHNIPYLETFGPDHSRYQLMVNHTMWHDNPAPEDYDRFTSAFNDGEEQIDAMIRADAYGLVSPLKPAEAAALAYKDAILTNRHTGLYASMWVAACIAAAFYYRDPVEVIQRGLEQLPARSRYAEVVRQALDISVCAGSWEKAYPEINKRWGHLRHAGTMNETAAIINALVNSRDSTGCIDFEKAICTTVMHGWDTDCSAATCGCIAGVMAGKSGIPEKWTAPLHDTFYTYAALQHDHSITNFAQRFLELAKQK